MERRRHHRLMAAVSGPQRVLSALALPSILVAHADSAIENLQQHAAASSTSALSDSAAGDLRASFERVLSRASTSSTDDASGRRAAGICVPQSLWALEPISYQNYLDCVEASEKTHDMTVVGAFVGVRADCWCKHNMTELVDSYSCCDDPNFDALCEFSCNDADCLKTEARECISKCPGICLEEDYAPEGCKCDGCLPYTRCIAGDSREKTEAGELDNICDDKSFDSSDEARQYMRCMVDVPLRTNWDRLQARAHCVCSANVSKAANDHSCCAATWAEDICAGNCLTEAECATTEAQDCLKACQEICENVHPAKLTQACNDRCYQPSSVCHKYRTCKPLKPAEFEYICDDGSKPAHNGCCQVTDGRDRVSENCPVTCGMRQRFDLPHGSECLCYQCSESLEEVSKKIEESIIANIWTSGQNTLVDIAKQARLELGPTQKMQEIMKQRNEKLLDMIAKHGGPVDAELEVELNKEAGVWNLLILEEAVRFKACTMTQKEDKRHLCDDEEALQAAIAKDNCGPLTDCNPHGLPTAPNSGNVRKKGKKDGSLNLIIGAVAVGAVLFLAAALGVVLVMYRSQVSKAKSAQAAMESAMQSRYQPGAMAPVDGDSNVVVGRPVSAAEGTASSGAVVQQAAEDETAKKGDLRAAGSQEQSDRV